MTPEQKAEALANLITGLAKAANTTRGRAFLLGGLFGIILYKSGMLPEIPRMLMESKRS